MARKSITGLPKSFPMNGGNGTYSYSKNSTVQREASMTAKAMMEEIIADKLDTEIFTSSSSNTFRIADLGCSVGPNTFIAMQEIIDVVEKQLRLKGICLPHLPEFQVFFNDQITNDFNTLFASIPPEKQYFVAGVPGSFHCQLFPKSSIHIVYSSFALHWLSEVPKEVLIKDSPSWNKGKILYVTAPDAVAEAFAAQFAKDMDSILNARAEEIVTGGMMLALTLAFPDGYDRSKDAFGLIYDALASCLLDMAHEGFIDEALVDSFNIPLYVTSPKEMEGLIAKNGCFSILRLELLEYDTELNKPVDTSKHVAHIRAAMEGRIAAHFGADIIDELFDRCDKKVVVYRNIDASCRKGFLLFLALQRK